MKFPDHREVRVITTSNIVPRGIYPVPFRDVSLQVPQALLEYLISLAPSHLEEGEVKKKLALKKQRAMR